MVEEINALLFQLSKDTGIVFDDYEQNEDASFWAYMCEECRQKYEVPERYLDDCSADGPVCSVHGCNKPNKYYIDMPFVMCEEIVVAEITETCEEDMKELVEWMEYARDNVSTGLGWECADTFVNGYLSALKDISVRLCLGVEFYD